MNIEGKNPDVAERSVKLLDFFRTYLTNDGISPELLRSNIGLFLTSSNLAKILFVNELYGRIFGKPGSIYEFGCHLGQNLVLFENLRAIYEPFNNQRRVVGFDMFGRVEGYPGRSEIDGESAEISGDGYSLPDDYAHILKGLFNFHQSLSVLPAASRLTLVRGDASVTVSSHMHDNPGEAIALAYLDLATYEPTKKVLDAIGPRLLKGSVLVADEFNFSAYPGASAAFMEFLRERDYVMNTSAFMRDRTIIELK